MNPSGTTAYLMQPGLSSSKIEAINTATGAVAATITIPAWGNNLVMAPNGSDLYVAGSYLANAVYVISTATNAITDTIGGVGTYPYSPHDMAINSAGTDLYVTVQQGLDVLSLTTFSVVKNIPLNGAEGVRCRRTAPPSTSPTASSASRPSGPTP